MKQTVTIDREELEHLEELAYGGLAWEYEQRVKELEKEKERWDRRLSRESEDRHTIFELEREIRELKKRLSFWDRIFNFGKYFR